MDADARRERKKIQRRNLVDARRKDTVIAEYIQTKYNHLYKEALKFHDTIKEKYSEKFDLRKTNEFKVLKTDATRDRKTQFTKNDITTSCKKGNSTKFDPRGYDAPQNSIVTE